MLKRLVLKLVIFLAGKEGTTVMAMFFAQRVILGRTKFDDVPLLLKQQVADILIESGLPELVPEDFKK